jgi:hypothetical protein
MNRARMTIALAALTGVLVGTVPAFANGGDFFEEFAANWQLGKNPDEGASYFGFVRDARGRALPNATVSATIKTIGTSMNVQSDVLGHYKIPGFSKSIDPKNVDISCGKPGYRQVARDRRTQRAKDAPVEVSCTLAPAAAQS